MRLLHILLNTTLFISLVVHNVEARGRRHRHLRMGTSSTTSSRDDHDLSIPTYEAAAQTAYHNIARPRIPTPSSPKSIHTRILQNIMNPGSEDIDIADEELSLSSVGEEGFSSEDSEDTPERVAKGQSKYAQNHNGRTWAEDHPEKAKENKEKKQQELLQQQQEMEVEVPPPSTDVEGEIEGEDDDGDGSEVDNALKEHEGRDDDDDYYDNNKNDNNDNEEDDPEEEQIVEEKDASEAESKNTEEQNEVTNTDDTDNEIVGETDDGVLNENGVDQAVNENNDDEVEETASPTVTLTSSPTPLPTMATATPTTTPIQDTNAPTIAATAMPTASPVKMTNAPTVATAMPTASPVKITNAPTAATATPTSSPTAKDTEPVDADDDSSEDESESESDDGRDSIDFEEDEENSTSSPTGDRTSYSESEPTMEQIYENLSPEQVNFLQHQLVVDEEKEAAKISVLYFIITLILMIFTAQQMSENPDGVYANVCRLAITITGCILKIVLLPFRKYCGLGGRQGYSHHLVTTSDPYARTSRMEIL